MQWSRPSVGIMGVALLFGPPSEAQVVPLNSGLSTNRYSGLLVSLSSPSTRGGTRILTVRPGSASDTSTSTPKRRSTFRLARTTS